MKILKYKSLWLIVAVIFTFQGAFAQMPQNRTLSTVLADALAQLPANKPEQYNQTMNSLITTGEEGILTLLQMMDATGKKSNDKIEFAISGWTNFVATNEIKRKEAANAYGKALKLTLGNTTKQFVIKQLELIGDESNIEVLASFLNDEKLAAPASQALANMEVDNAHRALIAALATAKTDQYKLILINAIGQTENENAEPAMLLLLKSNPTIELKSSIYRALSKVGSTASIPVLKDAAKQLNFDYGTTNATVSYVDLLNKLVNNYPTEVQREAEGLLIAATNLGKQNLRISAIELLMSIKSVDKNKLLTSVLKDPNTAFVSHALSLYTNYADQQGISQAIKSIKKNKSDDTKGAIMYWLGNKKANTAIPTITKYLKSENPALQKAAVRSLSDLGGENVLKTLIKMLSGTNSETLANVESALAGFDGNIANQLVLGYSKSSEEGKIIILNLLGLRKSTDYYQFVLGEMSAQSKNIQTKAAQTLRHVATINNLPDLFNQLENENGSYMAQIQDATNAVLSEISAENQLKLITERMNKSDKAYAYYQSLANTGTKAALDIIMKGYRESGKNAEYAFNALLTLKSFDAVYPLLDIVRDSKNNVEKGKAVNALTSLISKSDKTGMVKANYLQEIMPFAQTTEQKANILKHLGNTDTYQAFIFTEQFLDDKSVSEFAAQAGMKIALNNLSFTGANTNRILEKIKNALSGPDATYQRQAIDKYLFENKNAQGFESIFNGKDLTGWKGLVGNPISRAKMTKDELSSAQLKADTEANGSWKVENGQLIFVGKGNNLCTEKLYGDFEMMVDWKLFKGDEPDAGIYLRGTPQVQIWDTARVNVGAQVGSGGLYNNRQNESKPLTVADQKVGEWNTFHIKMVGDRVTVYLNGELVTNNVILENYWNANLPIFLTEQIELQAHGSKVAYRNIYIKEIARPEPFKLSKQEEKDGFEILFDGTNMHKWTGNTADYITQDGNIVIYPSNNYGGNLYTKEEFSDFIFRFEFQLTSGANNGLGIRTPMEGDAAYVGMELQILDNEDPIYKNLAPYQYHGSVYGIIPAKRGFLKPTGEWNYQEVIAKGDYIKITLNGTVILEGNIREATKQNGPMDHKLHPGLFNKQGHIAFLGHGSVVKFKDIRIKRIK